MRCIFARFHDEFTVMITHNIVTPITDQASSFLYIKQTKSFITAFAEFDTVHLVHFISFPRLYADCVFKTYGNSGQLMYANRFASLLGEITVKCCYLHLKMIRIGVSVRRGAVRDDG